MSAASCLCKGGIVAFPTETVYGLGADVFNTTALARVFEVKRRPYFDPLIVHIAELSTLMRLVDYTAMDAEAIRRLKKLANTLMPGPLTLILPKLPEVPDLATGGLKTVAVRFPKHSGALALIKNSTGAVAAPSANPFGYLSPTRAEHVAEQLGNDVDIILDGGTSEIGVESTVLDLSSHLPRILRPGGVSREEIEAFIGKLDDVRPEHPHTEEPVRSFNIGQCLSPGQLKSHYAPRTKLFLLDTDFLCKEAYKRNCAYLFFNTVSFDLWKKNNPRAPLNGGHRNIFILSHNGDLRDAASNLFEKLHCIDAAAYSAIYAERAPDKGLGRAINDRLEKASNK